MKTPMKTKHRRTPVVKAPTKLEITKQRLDEAHQRTEYLRGELTSRDATIALCKDQNKYLSTEVQFLRQVIQHLVPRDPR